MWQCTDGSWFEASVDGWYNLPNQECIKLAPASCHAVAKRSRDRVDRCSNTEESTLAGTWDGIFTSVSVYFIYNWVSHGVFWTTAAPVLEAAVLPDEWRRMGQSPHCNLWAAAGGTLVPVSCGQEWHRTGWVTPGISALIWNWIGCNSCSQEKPLQRLHWGSSWVS